MIPHPFGIIFNILNTGITINPEIYPPINTILYLMLILPEKYKNYIHDDYIKFYDTISLSINIKLNHINDIVSKFNCYSIN
jgi:general stress protein CsbA